MNLKPLHDRVVLRRVKVAESTHGGIVIPDVAKEKPLECVVIAVGEGRRTTANGCLIPMSVQEDDHVLVGKYNGTEIKIDGEEFLIVREEEILGVLE